MVAANSRGLWVLTIRRPGLLFLPLFVYMVSGCGGGGGTENQNPVPELASVTPSQVDQSSTSVLTLMGSGFVSSSQVLWNGAPQPAAFVNASQLSVTLSPSLLASSGWSSVAVINPPPGGGASEPLTITVLPLVGVIYRVNLGALNPAVSVPDISPTSSWIHATISDDARFFAEDFAGLFLVDACIGQSGTCTPSYSSIDPAGIGPSISSNARFLAYSQNNSNAFLRDTCLPTVQGCSVSTRQITQEFAEIHTVKGVHLSGDGRALGALITRGDHMVGTFTFGAIYQTNIDASSSCMNPSTFSTLSPFPVSDDGRYVALQEGTLWDLCNGSSEPSLPGGAIPSLSGNGRYIVAPQAMNGDSVQQIYMEDTCAGVPSGCTPATTRVSVADDGTPLGGLFGIVSQDGSTVAFSTGDSSGANPQLAMEVFVRQTCVNPSSRPCSPSTTKVSVGLDGSQGNGRSLLLSLTRDGRYVLFASTSSNFVPSDTNNATDLFLARTGQTRP